MNLSIVKSNPLVLRAVMNLFTVFVLFVAFGIMIFTGAGQFCPFIPNFTVAVVWFAVTLLALSYQLKFAEKQLRQALILAKI